MKQFLLLIAILYLPVIGFSQNFSSNSNNWNNSIFEEKSKSQELKVYPNPCKTKKLTVDFGSKEIAEIRLTNIAGKEVMLRKLQFPTNKHQVQLENIPNGIYLLRVKTTDDKLVVKKVLLASN